MDSEDIVRRVSNIKLHSGSSEAPLVIPVTLETFGQQCLETCLIGKVLSAKVVNRETFQVHMPRILQAKKKVNIEVVGENIFLLDFGSESDRRYALLDGPWSFFKDLIVFKSLFGLQKPSDMSFDTTSFWIQCHNVTLAFMHSSIIQSFGERLGNVIEIDVVEGERCVGKFARVRVELDITKPLRLGIWVQPESSIDEICIVLLYERLPNFCYGCGRIGHVVRDCHEKGIAEAGLPLGNWIRASSLLDDRKVVAPKDASSHRSDSPSIPSQEREVGFTEPVLMESQCKVKVGTSDSKDSSDTDENSMCIAEKVRYIILG